MTTIKSIRKGFANNSSSSHSIILVTDENFKKLYDYSNGPDYGWDHFTIKSREEKEQYLFTNLASALRNYITVETNLLSYEAKKKLERDTIISYFEENKHFFPFKKIDDLIENFKNDYGHVDHQSIWDIPVDTEGKLNAEFYGEFCKEVLEKNYVILGGNDNGDSHQSRDLDIGISEIVSIITNNTPW